MKMIDQEYYKLIEENDTYPSHSHQWIVRTYTDRREPYNDKLFYRNFGPFQTSQEAKKFLDNYRVKYTTKRFISMFSIEPLCEVL